MLKCAILAIGDELLKGATINTNAAEIGAALLKVGVMPCESLMISDDETPIISHVHRLCETMDVLILSGGLGPTTDDLTVSAVAKALQLSVSRDARTCEQIEDRWYARFDSPLPACNLKQADQIETAQWIPNLNGSAKGQYLQYQKTSIFILPGPPAELLPMLHEFVVPKISKMLDYKVFTKTLYVYTLPESLVEQRTHKVLDMFSEVRLAWCASVNMVKIFLLTENESLISVCTTRLKEEFGNQLMEAPLLDTLVNALKSRHDFLTTAESCTGGMIAESLTDISGISSIYLGGVVSYHNEAKQHYLNVSNQTLQESGAVSEACCAEMLQGIVAHNVKTTSAIAVTGIAGPNSDGSSKPVGLVYIGTYYRGESQVNGYQFKGTRQRIRQITTLTAFYQLLQMIEQHSN